MSTADIAAVEVVERTWPAVVKLDHPIEFGTETVGSLTFRRGKLADLKGIKIDGVPTLDQLIMIASRMCGQPLKVLESLDSDDSGEVIEIVLSFFARSLGATRTS